MDDFLIYLMVVIDQIRDFIDPVMIWSICMRLFFLMIGLEYALFILRRLDKRMKVDWIKVANNLENDARGAGLYFGLRYAGTAIAVAIAIS